jgi:hypothetical protein
MIPRLRLRLGLTPSWTQSKLPPRDEGDETDMARQKSYTSQYRGAGKDRDHSLYPLTTEEFAWLLSQAPSADEVELYMAGHTVGYDEKGRAVAVLTPFGEGR